MSVLIFPMEINMVYLKRYSPYRNKQNTGKKLYTVVQYRSTLKNCLGANRG